ncbi:collagenase-like protease, partial [Salmonella enterica subsp. enterica serovar Oslo]|nr:collagenase-like protease [Salmonella enterica subsp. enterica serovar Oslo]
NTVENTGHNRYRVLTIDMPADLHKVRPHDTLYRNLDHIWKQALTKSSCESRVAVDFMLGGWQDQLILTLNSEECVCIKHTIYG